jgi:hypothetical protein
MIPEKMAFWAPQREWVKSIFYFVYKMRGVDSVLALRGGNGWGIVSPDHSGFFVGG